MGVCRVCNREMNDGSGCIGGTLICNGKKYARIKAGDEGDFVPSMGEGEKCHDCATTTGNYHHWGCDAERCPACGLQLISCDCEDVQLLVPNEK